MRQFLLYFMAVFFLGFSASYAQGVITLTDSDDINDAMMISNSIDNVSSAVTSCMSRGENNTDCQCRNRGKINNFVRIYEDVMDDHPEWYDQAVYYEKPNGVGVTTMFGALQNQVDAFSDLDC